ncbi:hypothetical protein [uncultured Mycolicibacterium sp.]|uniref:hypothetical protein n=1 Tax=uncultured Mycolicibacterium sp. TaxID=2320817 RepID=UPI0026257426|nr:hypothetical protein [uncultured Mycolicibacterium sp.]
MGEAEEAQPPAVLALVRRVLAYRLSIAELIGLAILLATPYLVIGVVWSATHTDHLAELSGADLVVSFLGSIVSWPVLLFADVCMV